MGKVTAKVAVSNVETLEDLKRYVSIALGDIAVQINGNISFADNVSAKVVPASFTTANATVIIAHGLGRTPAMWIVGSVTANSVIYQTSESDGSNLYLAASATCDAKVLVI